ncbi:hypothetical protein KEM56_000929 [Ascosphaera pollenicola]|nr:hypothetical protein KEM56_000929 [Ascosphaera pollenicola]
MVPGAWQSPEQYAILREILHHDGFQTESIQLPSVGSSDPANESVTKDVRAIREKMLLPLINQGKEIVLLMHSYGGCPGGAAAKGLSKEQCDKGGIIGLVFLAAFLAREGDSLKSVRGDYDPWVITNDETLQVTCRTPIETFYNDVPKELAEATVKTIQPHSQVALASPSPPSAWSDEAYNGRRAYILAQDDQTIPYFAQELMLEYSGVDWETRTMDTGHCPFLSKPQETAEVMEDLISGFQLKSKCASGDRAAL